MHPSHTHASAVAVTTRHLSVPRWRAWSVAVVALFLVALFGVFSAQASATASASLYWVGDGSVGTVGIDDATGALRDGTRNNSVSTGCVGNYDWTANSVAVYGANGRYVCRGSFNFLNPAADSTWITTSCGDSPGVGAVYATDDYVYYMCTLGGVLGRVDVDGTNNIQNFGNSGGASMDYAYRLAVDANWIYVTGSQQIRRYPIDGGSMDSSWAVTGVGDLRGLAVDSQYLYWSTYPSRFIGRANLDGTARNSEWIAARASSGEGVWGITVTGSSIYWMTRSAGSVGRANLDGTGVVWPLLDNITAGGQNHKVVVLDGTAKTPLAAGPTNSAAPAISGTVQVGEIVTATSGTWSAEPDLVYYQWEVSDDSGATWSQARGSDATTNSYAPNRADVGKQLRVRVRAGANGGVLTAANSTAQTIAAIATVPSATLYWAGNTAVSSMWVNDTTGVAIPGGRVDGISTGLSGTDAFGWNATKFYIRQSSDQISQKNLDGTGSATDLVDTLCSTVRGSDGSYQGVGSIYATAEYVYYNCSVNTWIGRVDADGQNNIRHFADGPGMPPGHFLTGDANWLYSYGGGAIYRAPIDGGPSQVIVNNTGDVRGITTDGTYLYWASTSYSNRIGRAKLDGTDQNNTWLETQNSGYIWGLTATGSRLYWAARTGSEGQVGSAKLDGTDINPTLVAGITDMTNATNRARVHVVGGTALPPLADPLRNSAQPTITGTPEVGQTLTAADGTWSATPSQVYYLWQVSADSGETWSTAPGTNSQSTYTPTISDIGKTVRLKVRAGATGGLLATEYAAATVAVAAPPAPVNGTAPAVTLNGLFRLATAGAWTDSTSNITYTYQWQVSETGADGTWVSATGPGNATAAYVTQAGDVGLYMRAKVTAFNGSSSTAFSEAALVAAPSPLSHLYVNRASLLADGASLQRYSPPGGCGWNFSSNGTTNVWGCSNNVYTAPADGSASPTSVLFNGSENFYGALIDDEYIYFTDSTVARYIQRMKIDGTELDTTFIDPGTVNARHYMTFDAHYIYYHRGPAGNNSIGRAPISGGTGETLVRDLPSGVAGIAVDGDHVYWTYDDRVSIGRADISGSAVETAFIAAPSGVTGGGAGIGVDQNGIYYSIREGANSGVGIASLDGSASAPIAAVSSLGGGGLSVIPGTPVGALPVLFGDTPQLTDNVRIGNTVSATSGQWSNTPQSYTYRWLVSNHGADVWTAATGATGTTADYVVPQSYGGKDLKVRVIAHNGATWSDAAYSSVVTVPAPPVNAGNADAPSISGTVTVGETLTAAHGTWSNAPDTDAGYAYEWQVSTNLQDWTPALGEGGDTAEYDVDLTDDNKYLRVKVTATNAAASVEAFSAATSQVSIPAPTSSEVPQITGTVEIGLTLVASTGTWDFATDYAYVWESSADGSTWETAPGSGATTSSYTIAAADTGRYLRVRVTGSNRIDSLVVQSESSIRVPSPASPVVPSPVAETPPPPVFSPAPGITLGETRGEAALAAAVPAAGADLLRGANIWVRPTSKVEYLASSLPAGLKLVNGKLMASKPGTYTVKMKVKRKNGTSIVRTVKIKVG
jgi:hypothetical protein